MSEPGPAAAYASTDRPVQVVFRECRSGWVDFDVLPLTAGWRVQATHLDSPFGAMLRWLEAILDGAETVRWAIDGECRSTEFVFLAPARHCITRPKPRLLAIDGDGAGETVMASMSVEPLDLVRVFYESFRSFAETSYDPHQWEFDCEADEFTWEGEPLRLLRSATIEAALRVPYDEQLTFDPGWR